MSDLFPLPDLSPLFDGDGTDEIEKDMRGIMTNRMEMRISSSNVRDFPRMSPARVKYAIGEVLEIGGVGCVRFGQEFWHGINNKIWHDMMKEKGLRSLCIGPMQPPNAWSAVANPVSVHPSYYKILGAEIAATVPGTGRQPDRVISVVRTERQGFKIAFVNIHNFSERDINRKESDLYISRLIMIINELYRLGFNVIYGGDWNKSKLPNPPRRSKQIVSAAPDALYALTRPGITVRVLNDWHMSKERTKLDHVVIGAHLEWTKK